MKTTAAAVLMTCRMRSSRAMIDEVRVPVMSMDKVRSEDNFLQTASVSCAVYLVMSTPESPECKTYRQSKRLPKKVVNLGSPTV